MMLRPRESYDQRVLACDLLIDPAPSTLRSMHDVFGNCVSVATFRGRTRELVFDSRVTLDHTPLPAFADMDGEIEVYTGAMPFAYSPEDLPDLLPSLARQPVAEDDAVERWARSFVRAEGKTYLQTLLSDMTQAIYADFKYNKRLEAGVQTPAETLARRRGTCRDFAVLMIDAVRALGLAARFVSGYIYSPLPLGADRGRAGGGHTHAWVRVFLPACGWVEFDPTNGIVGNTDLIRVAVARDPRQATPLYGTWMGRDGDFLDMDVEVDVRTEYDPERQLSPPRAVGLAS
jgi:transglutaminase-like putative cysteine protease